MINYANELAIESNTRMNYANERASERGESNDCARMIARGEQLAG